jgi:transcriptional regulator with XRE-family HTH domain
MIKTNKQLKVTLQHIEGFGQAIAGARAAPPQAGIAPEMHRARIAGMESMVESLRREVREYQGLVAGDRESIQITTWSDLPAAIIKHRIASGWSQAEFARRLKVRPQQVQRWEEMDNQTVSFSTLCEMAELLGIRFENRIAINKIVLVSVSTNNGVEHRSLPFWKQQPVVHSTWAEGRVVLQ